MLFHKQSTRGEFDFSIVCAAMKVDLDTDMKLVRDVALCYSGVSAYASPACKAMSVLKERYAACS